MASNVTRDHHNLRRNLKLNGNYISNDGGDEGIAIDDDGIVTVGTNQLTVDRNVASTDAGTYSALEIDLDKTGASTTNNTMYGLNIDMDNTTATAGINAMYGIYCTPTLTIAEDAGVAVLTGIYSLVTGGTNGTSSAYGMQCEVTGADDCVGIHIKNADGGSDIKNVSSANAADYSTINTIANGQTTLTTVDDSGTAAHLNMVADGNFTVDAVGDISLDADGDQVSMKFGGATGQIDFSNENSGDGIIRQMVDAKDLVIQQFDGSEVIRIADDRKLYFFDKGGEHIASDGNDLTITSGVNLNIDAGGHVEFDGCGVGFDLETPTYDASDTDVNFINGNKQFVTFDGGDITDLNLIFPKVSGNFLLMLKQDGTGSRTVTNYKVWDRIDSQAGSGSATVKFSGGSNPDFTDDANHVDIISFFYDCDNEIAYGVASLDFQF